MTEERVTPLRRRMIEDMNIRGLGDRTRKAHIRNVNHFVAFLGRSPDTATPEELWSYQLKMTEDGVSASTFNVRIISLRFFFGVTCGRDEMERFMQFHRKPRKLPVVLSVEEVGDLLAAVPGPGLKYRVALGTSYCAGLRASEVCHLKVADIDSDRMLIHVDEGMGVTSHLISNVPETEKHVEPMGDVGAFLARRFKEYSDDHTGWSKEIWDMAAVAWLLNLNWTPSIEIPTPVLSDEIAWSVDNSRPMMRYVRYVHRDAILKNFFTRLEGFTEGRVQPLSATAKV